MTRVHPRDRGRPVPLPDLAAMLGRPTGDTTASEVRREVAWLVKSGRLIETLRGLRVTDRGSRVAPR